MIQCRSYFAPYAAATENFHDFANQSDTLISFYSVAKRSRRVSTPFVPIGNQLAAFPLILDSIPVADRGRAGKKDPRLSNSLKARSCSHRRRPTGTPPGAAHLCHHPRPAARCSGGAAPSGTARDGGGRVRSARAGDAASTLRDSHRHLRAAGPGPVKVRRTGPVKVRRH